MEGFKHRLSRKWQSVSQGSEVSRSTLHKARGSVEVEDERPSSGRREHRSTRTPLWNEYSDLTIFCKGTKWPAHKLYLCTQSDFFRNACKDSFKEGRENIIYLDDDDPQVVNAMLLFLYEKRYDPPEGVNPWEFHANVAAIADKYFIQPLQHYAERKFNEQTERAETLNGFTDAIAAAYDSGNKHMIDTVIQFTKANSKRLFSGKNGPVGYREILHEIPEYAASTAEVLAEQLAAKDKELASGVRISKKELKEHTWFRCPDQSCDDDDVVFAVPAKFARDSYLSCPMDCDMGRERSSRWWNKYKIASPYSS